LKNDVSGKEHTRAISGRDDTEPKNINRGTLVTPIKTTKKITNKPNLKKDGDEKPTFKEELKEIFTSVFEFYKKPDVNSLGLFITKLGQKVLLLPPEDHCQCSYCYSLSCLHHLSDYFPHRFSPSSVSNIPNTIIS